MAKRAVLAAFLLLCASACATVELQVIEVIDDNFTTSKFGEIA